MNAIYYHRIGFTIILFTFMISCLKEQKQFTSWDGFITLKLPKGWSTAEQRDGQEYSFNSPNKNALLSIVPLYWAKDSASQISVLEGELAHNPGATRTISSDMDIVYFITNSGSSIWLVRKMNNLYKVVYKPSSKSESQPNTRENKDVQFIIATLRP